MGEIEFDGYLAEARRHVSAANYDVQRMSDGAGDRQALHSIVLALDAILAALEHVDAARSRAGGERP
ncbi:MAG: hypothetical protein BGO45_15665 [Microbacterium sp. 71-36]|uniref:hypothetical protein n=1 Tax=unclassified Microbacterium TaxID=2609290 RepID=UPI00086CCFCF|nr:MULTISPECIES: hypothetical protein [unclassified Microbacterium]MBN9212381.1 hypothetical protein [Microbacterium sp.]ODT38679.1 MAG: hypothetical protein ABS60_09610 [Microbacterium sp. SCN 71-17]OJV78110.1 MAG: hypothetical protein BGO45_15665 [Microbacterium sp. 71-36]